MPIFEYKCQQCGETFELRITSQSQVDSLICKICGSKELERKISVPNISSGRSTPPVQTCCGREQRCSDAGGCCGH
jgi:putative FmdB family regulatory protein